MINVGQWKGIGTVKCVRGPCSSKTRPRRTRYKSELIMPPVGLDVRTLPRCTRTVTDNAGRVFTECWDVAETRSGLSVFASCVLSHRRALTRFAVGSVSSPPAQTKLCPIRIVLKMYLRSYLDSAGNLASLPSLCLFFSFLVF